MGIRVLVLVDWMRHIPLPDDDTLRRWMLLHKLWRRRWVVESAHDHRWRGRRWRGRGRRGRWWRWGRVDDHVDERVVAGNYARVDAPAQVSVENYVGESRLDACDVGVWVKLEHNQERFVVSILL